MNYRSLGFVALILAATAVAASPATAGHDSPLYVAASQYREAVREFERQVLRSHYVDRHDERLVDDLEDETSRLKSAARDPHRTDRLMQRWYTTQSLHTQVEAAIFGYGRYPHDPLLSQYWGRVRWMFSVLAQQIHYCPAPTPVIEHPVRDPYEPVRIHSPANPFGFQTYRQPFSHSAADSSTFGNAYRQQPAFAEPVRSYDDLRRSRQPDMNRGQPITIPRTQPTRRDISGAAVGALLMRLRD